MLMLRPLIWLVLSLMAVGYCRADTPPDPPHRYTIYSRNRAFEAIPDPNTKTTTIYKLGQKHGKVRQWSVRGWNRVAFLANDGRHLVIGYDGSNLLSLDYRPDWKMVSFYDRSRLVRAYSLAEVILDRNHLQRTASHFYWGYYWGIDKRGQFVLDTVEGRRLVFDVDTGHRIKTLRPVSDEALEPEPPTPEEEAANRWEERPEQWKRSKEHSGVDAIVFSPDGKHVLSAHTDGKVYLWDITTGMELGRFDGHESFKTSLSFSPDGKYALDGNVLWDATTGTQIRRFGGVSDRVDCAVYGSDGQRIVAGMKDGTVRLWDAATGEEIRRFEGAIASVAMSRDSAYVVGGNRNGLTLWDTSNGNEIRRFDAKSEFGGAVAISPDGKYLLMSSLQAGKHVALLWETETGKLLRRFTGHSSYIYYVAFSCDGKFALTSSCDDTARLWDVNSGEEIRKFNPNLGSNNSTNTAAISPDGLRVLTGGNDGFLRLWNVATSKLIRRF